MGQFTEYNFCRKCGDHAIYHTGRLFLDCPKQETTDLLFNPEANFNKINPPVHSNKQDARAGIAISGKKMRIVFKEGRDLNIFNIQSMNVDGQWWRIIDGEGALFVVDPAKVNYTETKA